jgi:glucose/arabinose dehydrogenase
MKFLKLEPILWTVVGLLGIVCVLSLFPKVEQADGVAVSSASAKLVSIGSFSQPLGAVQAPGDNSRLYVVEQGGKIQLLVNGHKQAQPFLNISSKVSCCGEQGLLSAAFAPDYKTSGKFYVDYTDVNGDTRVVEYRRSGNPNLADPNSARVVLAQAQPQTNHNGGQLAFGPEGYLYISFGDGGGQGDQHGAHGNAQNLGVLLGKILRVNPAKSGSAAYTVPHDNPFYGRAGARGEIWSYGLRNPWRFSFDKTKGGMIIGDVGQNTIEEVDWAAPPSRGRGNNYGWRVWEGTNRYNSSETAAGAVAPTAQYTHTAGRCSITGGYVVRDPRLTALYGNYLFADFCSGQIWQAALRTGKLASHVSLLPMHVNNPSSFGQDNSGHIYISSLGGRVYRLDP